VWGSKTNLTTGGVKVVDHFVVYAAISKLYTGILIITLGDKMSLTVNSDKVMMKDAQVFVDLVEKKHAEIMAGQKGNAINEGGMKEDETDDHC